MSDDPIERLRARIEAYPASYSSDAPLAPGKDPMEMTLGEWMRAPVLSANALLNDLLDRRSTPPSTEGDGR